MLDIKKIKSDFPILNNKSLIYLDSSASSQKPQQVIQAIADYYENQNANINRGIYDLATQSTQAYEQARTVVADFIGATDEEIIFTRNTTESLNLIAYAWGLDNFKKSDEIILTQMEHHSNIVPWQIVAAKTGAILKFLEINEEGELENIKNILSEKTKLVSLAHVSNVLSTINPVADIFKQVKKHNPQIICVLDAAQSVPHMRVDVKKLKADFIAFSGHKMLGPMGIGVLWGKKEILEKMTPFLGGGDMIARVDWKQSSWADLPRKFEAGTPNVAGAVGLAAAIKYLQTIGMDQIAQHEQKLTTCLLTKLQELAEIKILGPKQAEQRGGLVSFVYEGVHAHDVAQILDSVGVAVRAGHHCAMPLHKKLKIVASSRASFYLYNDTSDIDQLIAGLAKVKKVFKL